MIDSVIGSLRLRPSVVTSATRPPRGVLIPGSITVQVVTSSTRPLNPFNGVVIYETDSKLNLQWNGVAWIPVFNLSTVSWIVTAAGPGVWIKPAGVLSVHVYVIGGGGGGGGGRRGAASTIRGGGSGGNGGNIGWGSLSASLLSDEISYSVGSGGIGGGPVGIDSDGSPGTAGGMTSFGSVRAGGGLGGLPGTSSGGGSSAFDSLDLGMVSGGRGGGNPVQIFEGYSGSYGRGSGGGGGQGGQISASNVVGIGGLGGPNATVSVTRTPISNDGSSIGSILSFPSVGGAGGGGGSGSISNNAIAGGNGGYYGGGGGGGGGATGYNAGGGGNGAAGALMVTISL